MVLAELELAEMAVDLAEIELVEIETCWRNAWRRETFIELPERHGPRRCPTCIQSP